MKNRPVRCLFKLLRFAALCSLIVLSQIGVLSGPARAVDTANLPVPVGVDGLYGYLNQDGTWAITPRFEAANPFRDDGAAWVQFKGKYGRIDAKGGWVVQPQFESVGGFAANGLAKVKVERKYGFIDAKGQWVIQPQFESAGAFAANGLAWVEVKSKYGFIDAKGQWVIQPQFEDAGDFAANGLAPAAGKGRGFIDAKGQWVIRPQYPTAHGFAANGLALAQVTFLGKYGFINAKGQWVIQPQYDYATDFDNGLAYVEINKKIGLIDTRGQWVLQPKKFDENSSDMTRKHEYAFFERMIDGRWHCFNAEGNCVVPFERADQDPAAPRWQRHGDRRELEHFAIENIYLVEMLWPCEAKRSKAREIGVGGLCPP